MGRRDGAQGLVEAKAIRALAAGKPYVEATMGQWRRGLGKPRQDNHAENSQNIFPVCHATGLELGEEDGDALATWAADQLCLNPAGSEWNTGGDGLECGGNHYGCFSRGAILRAVKVLERRGGWGDRDRADILRRWVRGSLAWFELLECLPVGMRCQLHTDDVPLDLMRVARGRKLAKKRLAQVYRWPVAVAASGAVPIVWHAEDLAAWRVRVAFEVRRYERGIWAAMLRRKGNIWNDNGSPSYAAYRVADGPAVKLEIDPKRNPSPATVEVHQDGAQLVTVATHEAAGDQHELRLDTAPLGRLLWVARVPAMGPVEITPE